jgi:hypothetical protein
MDVILLVIIPLALLLDFCCGGDAANRKQGKIASRVMSLIGCCCFSVLFMIEAFIFNTYMETGHLDGLKSKVSSNAQAFNIFNIFSSVQSQLEFLTLTGIIFGALM